MLDKDKHSDSEHIKQIYSDTLMLDKHTNYDTSTLDSDTHSDSEHIKNTNSEH